MLLLSSATRILATERPPGSTGYRHNQLKLYWSTRTCRRQSPRNRCVSEVEMAASANSTCTKGQGPRALLASSKLKNSSEDYQGISFFMPFFLLLDSFWFASLD